MMPLEIMCFNLKHRVLNDVGLCGCVYVCVCVCVCVRVCSTKCAEYQALGQLLTAADQTAGPHTEDKSRVNKKKFTVTVQHKAELLSRIFREKSFLLVFSSSLFVFGFECLFYLQVFISILFYFIKLFILHTFYVFFNMDIVGSPTSLWN